MKRKLLFFIPVLLIALCTFFYFNKNSNTDLTVDELRTQHQEFLDNSPFKNTKYFSKEKRKELGLPPNGYNEQMWDLTLDPKTGRPMPEKITELQESLRSQRASSRGVGGDASNPWIERGPNNIAGRTRAIMFDPNDVGGGNGDGVDYNRVFAGGVSGGLWVNNDITDANSSWTQVAGIVNNISVTVIISDPNTPTTFYLGSGESYTSGDAVGNGIWKSTDSGATWTNVLGASTTMSGSQLINGIFYINDLVARDKLGTTELYASVAGAFYGDSSPSQFHGLSEQGLYKSTNNGTSWTKFTIDESNGSPSNPNDIELDMNNNIWFTTTRSNWGFAGGKIFRSTDGLSFTLMHTIANASRTEIETSQNSPNTLWVLANVSGEADIYTTTDAFTITTQIATEPNDADLGISSTDFTRGQAFYDLEIEADASDNLIVGGIDLFRSTDNGVTWSQISKWSNNPNLNTLTVPFVHADQQAIVFRPGVGNANKMVFGCDGGIYYSDDITQATTSTSAITARNKDYATTQFYSGAIDPVDGGDGDDIMGGTQDNGTPLIQDGTAGINAFTELFGGDGAFTEIDDTGLYMLQAYTNNSHRYVDYPALTSVFTIATAGPDAIAAPNCNTSNGSFINEAELDKNLDILYSNASFSTFVCATGDPVSTTYRIERIAEFLPGGAAQVNSFLFDALLNAAPTALKVSPFTAGSTKLFVGLSNGRLLRVDTADGTPGWNNITGASFVGSISDIEFGQNESEMFVTMHNYGVTSVWFTANGGASWASKEGDLPSQLPVKCILQNPLEPNEVIIGTKLGVWATLDYTVGSPAWTQVNNGMNEVAVMDLDLRTADNTILASTHGRGMFTSSFTTNLGLADNSLSKNGIRVFPTINNGNFTVVAKSSLGNVKMKVYNIMGQEVHSSNFQLSTSQKVFNLKVNTGIYFVKLTGENFEGAQKIIIK